MLARVADRPPGAAGAAWAAGAGGAAGAGSGSGAGAGLGAGAGAGLGAGSGLGAACATGAGAACATGAGAACATGAGAAAGAGRAALREARAVARAGGSATSTSTTGGGGGGGAITAAETAPTLVLCTSPGTERATAWTGSWLADLAVGAASAGRREPGAASAAVTTIETTRPEDAAITAVRRATVPALAVIESARLDRGVLGRTAARCRPWMRLDKGKDLSVRLRGELSGSDGGVSPGPGPVRTKT